MERVSKASKTLGAEIYPGPADLAANRAWVGAAKAEGAYVYDIGPDFSRRALRASMGEKPESVFYQMELSEVTGYERYIPLW